MGVVDLNHPVRDTHSAFVDFVQQVRGHHRLAQLGESSSDHHQRLWIACRPVLEQGVVHGFSVLARRPVISRIVLGLVLVAFVLPAWIWYIVPWAQMTEAELEAMIHAEIAKEEQAAAVQEDSLDGDDSS